MQATLISLIYGEKKMPEYICKFDEEHGFLKSESMEIGDELIRCKDCYYFSSSFDLCYEDYENPAFTSEN